MTHRRDDFLGQEAHNNRVARRVRTIARVAFVSLVVVVVEDIAIEPGRAIDWLVSYLIRVGTLLAVGLCVFLLLVGLINKIPLSRGWERG